MRQSMNSLLVTPRSPALRRSARVFVRWLISTAPLRLRDYETSGGTRDRAGDVGSERGRGEGSRSCSPFSVARLVPRIPFAGLAPRHHRIALRPARRAGERRVRRAAIVTPQVVDTPVRPLVSAPKGAAPEEVPAISRIGVPAWRRAALPVQPSVAQVSQAVLEPHATASLAGS